MTKKYIYDFFLLALCQLLCIGCIDSTKNNSNPKAARKYISYQQAARAYDFEAAHQILDEMNNRLDLPDGMCVGEWEEKKEEAFDYIFNAEAMYLCSRGDKESIDRLTFLLTEIPIKGVAIPEGTEYKSEYDFDIERKSAHSEYISYATRFNQKCSSLIDLAISNHNYIIVEKVLPLFKSVPNPFTEDSKEVVEDQGFRISVSTKYRKQRLTYTNAMRDMAISKVNKAIKEGVFPNITEEIKDQQQYN